MAIQNLDYWFDGQQRRYLAQLVRAFSGFQYQTGYNQNGAPQLIMVPCTLANTNRQVANILRNNSENTLNSAPRITIWQTGLKGRREDVQSLSLVESLSVVERQVNPEGTAYTSNRGNAYTVQRLMPRPFQMDIQVDIWTTNLEQKHQLLEQILTIIYPSFDIQNSQNPIDWTALTTVYFEDMTLSSKNIPIGTDSEIDIASIQLRIPIWLSPPAKVKAQNIIKQIVTNILDGDAIDLPGFGGSTVEGNTTVSGTKLAQVVTTPGDHFIKVDGNIITMLNPKTAEPDDGTDYNWLDYLNKYGIFKPTQSSIWLYYTDDFENGPFVSGTLQFNPNAPNQLYWQIDTDTIPANTLSPINALINPLRSYPGNGLPSATQGTRYLIASDIGPSQIWGNITAYENDIIQYNHGAWAVAFSSHNVSSTQLVLNSHTGSQLRWTGRDWVMSIDTTYAPGYWRLKL